MHLTALLSGLPVRRTTGLPEGENPEVLSLEYDSRRVEAGALFFAVEGEKTDGHLYVDEAVRRGALAVASERRSPPGTEVAWIQVEAVRPFMGLVADRFWGHPSGDLDLVGITGTNGKTTTAFLVHSVLRQRSTALLMGTIKTAFGDSEKESVRTTPESVDLQKVLAEALKSGCKTGAVEVSSHALFFYRVYQCSFPVAVFCNLSQDHLDFHRSLEEYFQAKCRLFQTPYNPGLRHAVVNADDPFAGRIPAAGGVRKTTFGFSTRCDVHPRGGGKSDRGYEAELHFFDRTLSIRTSLPGEHNLYNVMAAAAASSLLGCSDEEILRGVEDLKSVPGRFEKVDLEKPFTVIVDYAHTPHALENALKLSRRLSGSGVICVFGCGGERDREKRPMMGAVAVKNSDWAVITSDNPRGEDPDLINREIVAGIPERCNNYEVVPDRREAISRALARAGAGDLVLIAGKGHETYQDLSGGRIHFDDREVVREVQ